MKKIAALFLVTALLLCGAVCFVSAEGTVPVQMNGFSLEIPALPVGLTHTAEVDYYRSTQYEYGWKFDTDQNAVLYVIYEVFDEPTDTEEYLKENYIENIEGVEILREEDHACFFTPPRQTGGDLFFLTTKTAIGAYVTKEGSFILAYENKALSTEETMAAVKAMIASLRFTELVPAVREEKEVECEVSTVEEIRELMERARLDNTTKITVTCSEELYLQLSENRFALTERLGLECGLADIGIRYSDRAFLIEISVREVTDIPSYAWADTVEQAEAAVAGFIAKGLANFSLGCPEEVCSKLYDENGIYSLAAKYGVGDLRLSHSGDLLKIEDMELFPGEWAVVEDVYSAADQLAVWHEQGAEQFALVYGKEVFEAFTDEEKDRIDFLGGVERSYSRRSKTGIVTYENVQWAEGKPAYCPTEEDILSAIRAFGSQGVSDFRIMTTEELYEILKADNFARLQELEAEAGMTEGDLRYYFGTPVFEISDAVIVANPVMLASLNEVIAYVDECVARQDTGIDLFLTADVYDDLMSGISLFQIGKSDAKFYDLIANAGIADGEFSYSRATHIISVKNMRLYAGTRILLAVQNGRENELSARDAETLAAARAMAAACAGPDELTTLKNIHDALCEKIVYTDDESTDEDDCAIGALLTGEANCDGYADALYLVGSLCGLEVRYQHGDSVEQGLGSMFATHMWNLVKLNGTWRLVDITWDDMPDSDPIYVWFNIGEDRAAKTHVWSREMTVSMDPVTDLSARFDAEYYVSTGEEVKAAVKDVQEKGLSVFFVYAAEGSELNIREALQDALNVSFYYSRLDGLNAMKVSF